MYLVKLQFTHGRESNRTYFWRWIILTKPTLRDVEKTIKRCLKASDNKTALNYYNNYKPLFKGLDLNKVKEEVKKPNKKVEEKIKENEELKESKEE